MKQNNQRKKRKSENGERKVLLDWLLSGINLISILRATFLKESVLRSFSLVTVWLYNYLAKEYGRKSRSLNVDEIDYRFIIIKLDDQPP
jgi:hypothetical protein